MSLTFDLCNRLSEFSVDNPNGQGEFKIGCVVRIVAVGCRIVATGENSMILKFHGTPPPSVQQLCDIDRV